MFDPEKMRTYYPVYTPLDCTESGGIEVAPEHFLRKAAEDQIDAFKKLLLHSAGETHEMFLFSPWEAVRNATTGKYESLPINKRRYWVIEHAGTNHAGYNLQLACGLLPSSLKIGVAFLRYLQADDTWQTGGKIYNRLSLPIFLDDTLGRNEDSAISISLADLRQVRRNFDLLKPFDRFGDSDAQPRYPAIERALRLFHQLDRLGSRSEMIIIGLFSVIEALILHDPKGSHDSLLHQLRTKMSLLAKRFEYPLDTASYFRGIADKKLWNTLYEYRSLIVHGGDMHATDGPLALLKKPRAIQDFLHESTKRLILLALTDPELFADLQLC